MCLRFAKVAAFLVCLGLGVPAAKAGLVNGGFEAGSLTGWTVAHLINPATIPTFPPTAYSHLGLTADSTNKWTTTSLGYGAVLTDVVGPGTDSKVSGGVRYPAYGNNAARINYNGNKNRASSIEQTATMVLADIDPSDGKVHVRFSIAPVLENPNHNPNEQPYFFVEVTNVTKGRQLFSTFNFSGQAGQPWVTVGTYQYTDWQSIDIAPGPGVLDVGDQVKVVIVGSGCGPNGHEGHVYVDSGLTGTSLPGPYISAVGPASAPSSSGTQLTYTYYYGNAGTAPLTNAIASIVPPQDNSSTRKNLTYVSNSIPASCTWTASPTPGELTCNLGTLNPSATGSFTVTFSLPNGGPTSPVNHGDYSLSGDNAAPVLGPLVQTVLTSVPLADLRVTVTDGVTAAVWGQTLTYTVGVANLGPSTANGSTLVETLPAALTAVTWTCAGTGASCPVASGSGAINQSGINLPSGASLTYTVTATATGSGQSTVNLAVEVTPPGNVSDPVPGNNVAADLDSVGTGLFTLTLDKTGTGTVTSVPTGIACGTGCATTSATYPAGSSVILYAVAPAGSIFSGWSGGGCTGSASSCTVTLNGDTVVSALFVTPLYVTPVVGANGSVSPSAAQPVPPGGATSFTVTPSAGYALQPVTDNCGPGGAQAGGTLVGTTWTTNAVSQSCNVNFSFTNTNVRTVTPSVGANGSVTPSTVQTIPVGGTSSFTVIANSGYAAATPGGTCPAGSWAGNVYTTGAVSTNCTVSFTFVAGYTASGLVKSGTGTISPLSRSVTSGGSAVFTITPGVGYTAAIDGTSTCPAGAFALDGVTYTVNNITADCTVVARFDAITYVVSGSTLAGTGTGTITPATRSVGYGGSATFTITPGAGFVAGIDASSTCSAGAFAGDGVTYTVTGIAADCTVVARFDAQAALALAKTHVGSFLAGGSGSYSLVVSNAGGVATSGIVTVTDNAPTGMAVTAMSGTGWTCTTLPACTRNDALGAGASYPAITVTVSVAGNAGSPLVNSATASGGGASSATVNDPTSVVAPAALAIAKSHTGSFIAGSTGTYTVTVSNGGGSATSGTVTVTDNAPAGMTVTAMSGTGWNCAPLPACTRSDALAAGASYPAITVTVSLAANAGTPLVNSATVSGGGAPGDTANDSTVVVPPGSLGLSKTHLGSFLAGGTGAYALTVTNGGAGPTNGAVTVTDTAPPGMTVTAMSGSGWTCTTLPTCTRGDALASGASYPAIAVTVSVAGNAGSPLVNSATVSGGGSASATATDSTVVVQPAALALAKSHSGAFVAGGAGAYSVTVSNTGGPTSGPVTVTDTAPAGMTVTAMSGSGWTCTTLPTCSRSDTLAAGASYPAISVSVSLAANAVSPLVNSASVSGGGSPTATTTDPTTIVAPATLAIAKSHAGSFTAGSTGTYTLLVTNGGGTATSGAMTVTDTAPAGMTVTAMAGTGWNCATLPACTRSDPLAAGSSHPAITVTVSLAANAGSPLVNSATVSGGGFPSATATDSTVVARPAALTLAKTHVGTFLPGGTGTYTLTVGNGGGATSGTVTVTDTAPPGMTVTAMSGNGWTCATPPTCIRADALAAGASYPPITVAVALAANAQSPLVNSATVSGGGSPAATATDSTTLGAAADMRVTLAGLPATTNPRVVVTGRLACTNQGAVDATGATCAVASGATASGCRSGTTAVTLPLATLAVGATIQCDVRATTPASGSHLVIATTGATNDSGSTGKSVTHTVAITPAAGTGSISGYVWYDLNRNGVLDSNEPRRAGWGVQLLSGSTVLASTQSGGDGFYVFGGLQPGRYSVRFVDPGALALATGPLPVDGDPAGNGGSPSFSQLVDINVTVGGAVVNQSLPIDPSGVVYDSVTRQPLAGATVALLLDGQPVDAAWVAGGSATQVTGAGGQYAFFLLPAAPAGTYSLVVSAVGYRPSPSASIAPTPVPAGFTGGSVGYPGAPPLGQVTTYYLSFPRPSTDITNNNVPLDSLASAAAFTPVPTLSEWAMILLGFLLVGTAFLERPVRRR